MGRINWLFCDALTWYYDVFKQVNMIDEQVKVYNQQKTPSL